MWKDKVNSFLTYLHSAESAQQYLTSCYEKEKMDDPQKYGYQNCYRFLYYLQHGQTFYKSGKDSPFMIQPILYFYGMVHLLKACLLTVKPGYPENTSVLAHGVSTRKRKKQQYSFLKDEVKIQHKGLFPYFASHLFHMENRSNEKKTMQELLEGIPEMNDLFFFHAGSFPLIKVGSIKEKTFTFPANILDDFHLTEKSFLSYINNYFPVMDHQLEKEQFVIKLSEYVSPLMNSPAVFHLEEENVYFPVRKRSGHNWHEVMSHYLLLYNLSMICRYETEWWGDLLHTLPNTDYSFIRLFMEVTSQKIPNILGYYLLEKHNKKN
ncbi:YaaC family protein [Sediminibacillus massiliensis]|uniref:YaaC family protein n=1 Tax=Sediminibacillus massiliensis TaxID=1926277 RepID=UPI0015C2FC79|nr:YaaC family protein [Sediminibacillus massiliensis]